MTRPALSRSLRALGADAIGRRLLAAADGAALSSLAEHLEAEDPYGERAHLAAALERIGAGEGAVVAALRHELWCAHREAAWRAGLLDAGAAEGALVVEGARWARETEGHPTVVIAPMTLALADASWVVTHAIRALAPQRRVVLYGEEVEPGLVGFAEIDRRMAGSGRAALRNIMGALSSGGVFCTYPDFVYQGHEAVGVQLFGRRHAISSAFVGIASRPGTMLLPSLASPRGGREIVCRFFEPILIAGDGAGAAAEEQGWRRRSVAQLVASTLERLIAEAPHQWRLLATLSHDAPQMERA